MMKKLLSLSALLMCSVLSFAFEVNGIAYNVTSDKNLTVEVAEKWYSGEIVIPEKVAYEEKEYSVTSIGNDAFSGCSGLTSVTIPNSVTTIGDFAFTGCSGLTSVTIPNSVTTIGYCAFSNCRSLTSINIPNSVTTIGYKAFYGCSGLTSVTIPNSVTSIGNCAFSGCSGLTSIKVESGNTKYDSRNNCNAIIETKSNTLIAGCMNTIIPNSVTTIGDYAFYYCSSLTSVTTPDSVTTIGYEAFYGCSSLTSVTIGNSVTRIGDWAFAVCSSLTSVTIGNSVTSIGTAAFESCSSLTSIKVESGNTKYDSRNNCNAIIETKSNTLVAGCKNTIIPNSVTSIGNRAYRGCSSLTSVNIPNSVTSIGYGAYWGCSSLNKVNISNFVTTVDDRAFEDCTSLKTIIIPNRLSSFGGTEVYKGCTAVESVIVRQNNPLEIGTEFFEEKVYQNATLYVPTGRAKYFNNIEGWAKFANIEEIEMDEVEKPSDSPYENIDRNQMILGYYTTDETCASDDGYGGSNAGLYKACVRYTKEQMTPFVGNNITNVRFALTSTNVTDAKLWIGSTRDKNDLYEQSIATLKEGWNEVVLQTPLEITGDSIFIGIEYQQSSRNYPVSHVREGSQEGSFYLYGPYNGVDEEGTWLIVNDESLSLQCIVEGDKLPQYDIHTVRLSIYEKYMKRGEQYYGYLYLRNWGKQLVNSAKIVCEIDGREVEERNINISTGIDSYYMYFNIDNNLSVGLHTITMRIKEINGKVPTFTADDTQSVNAKFYSQDMGRDKVLLELHTATWCPYTPRIHKSIAQMMEERDDIILLSIHHSDAMSTDASDAYSVFSDYTPTTYYNRYASYGANSLGYLSIDKAKNQPSLAKLAIEATFDENRREVGITIKGKKNDEFIPVEGYASLTVLLTEDNIVYPQFDAESGKTIYDYVHDGVIRANVSDVWGDPIVWNGDEFEMHYKANIDEEWVKDNINIVAFIAKPFTGSNFDEIEVVNCNDFALRNATIISGVDDVSVDSKVKVFVNGRSISVDGEYNDFKVYKSNGMRVDNTNLQTGTYIVKVYTPNGIVVKKISL